MQTGNPLPLFEAHGVDIEGYTDTQAYGTCPFTGKSKKFYINRKTGLWDSKNTGRSGNINDFLTAMADVYAEQLSADLLKKLARDRGLPTAAFAGWRIGWNGLEYTVPAYTPDGVCVDIRFFTPGKKMRSTPGAKTGLFGVEKLKDDPTDFVFVCEGEWDAVAWAYALRKVGRTGAVVGVPGAATFKAEWATYLRGRRVFAMYDHDAAGQAGLQVCASRVANTSPAVAGLSWPEGTPDGYDVRDEVKAASGDVLRMQAMVKDLMGRFVPVDVTKGMKPKPTPPAQKGEDAVDGEANTLATPFERATRWTSPPTLADVETTFKKWLYLDSTDALKVMLACVVSQSIDGSPIWVFLVAPPGGSKTEHLNSLSWVQQVYMTSSLTPHSLISGANFKSNEDPSLIPRLNGRVMVIKDFTAILGMRDSDKEEIFAILRDAYDGHCGKVFGNGIERAYTSRFTVLGAVTPRIYDLSGNHAALGERFLKFTLGDNIEHRSEQDIIRRAITNINRETSMREELADAVNSFLTRTVNTRVVPTIPDEIIDRIIGLAKFGARLRGTVSRDTYRNDVITSKPSAEVGSRLGVQMAKLGQSLAIVSGRQIVTMEEYRLLKKVMLDTIPQRLEDMVRTLLRVCPSRDDFIKTGELEAITRYPRATITRLMQDLNVLNVVRKKSDAGNSTWTLTDYIRDVIASAGLYTTDQEMNRKAAISLRGKRKVRS